jgi:hypothetical protein
MKIQETESKYGGEAAIAAAAPRACCCDEDCDPEECPPGCPCC